MDELNVPTPRSRSRSKTPFILRSQCDKEHCTDADHDHPAPVKRVPTVPTVDEERPQTPANVRSSARTTRKTIVVAAASTVETSQKATVVHTATSTNITSASTATRAVKSSASSTSSAGTSANGSNSIAGETNAFSDLSNKEINQQELHTMFADDSRTRMRTSTPIQSSAAGGGAAGGVGRIGRTMERKSLATAVLTADGNDHVPYREYRDAGEYWNKYPKTDYTYSRLSPHRREIVPGVIAMPNMSRRSLEQHHDRVNVMAEKAAPGFASFIRNRYQATNYQQATEHRRQDAYYDSQDSQDEVDEVRVTQLRRSWRISETRIVRWLSTIVRMWSTFLYTTVAGGGHDTATASNVYYTRSQPEAGWFSKITSVVTGSILSVFRYVYLAISTILFLDTWLLRSGTAGSPTKKRFLLLLLILLPLLLIAAWEMHDAAARDDLLLHWPRLAMSALPLASLSAIRTAAFDSFQMPFAFPDFPNVMPHWGTASDSASAGHPEALSDQQYRDLLTHLNRYVDAYVNERIVHTQHAATDASPAAAAAVLSEQHVADISAMINDRIVLGSAPNLDDIVTNVLQSDQLTERITRSVQERTAPESAGDSQRLIDEQQQLIRALQREIEQINGKLSLQQDAQQHIDESIRLLHAHHDSLAAQFGEFRSANEQRLAALLLTVNVRLDDLDGRTQFAAIDDRVKLVLMDVLGYRRAAGGDAAPDVADLQQWVRSVFVAKTVLEERLLALAKDRDSSVMAEIERSSGVLMKTVTERIREEMVALLEQQRIEVLQAGAEQTAADAAAAAAAAVAATAAADGLTEDAVRRIVQDALAVYDADKTGLVDYALESSGGEIVSTRCTETYHTKSAQISVFGIPLWYPTNTPRTAISPTVQPGQCWAFQGFPGFLVLKLNALIYVTGFTIEHIPRAVSPGGRIDSAPKTFTVWGLEHENDHEPLQFGTYEFQANGSNLQYFRVDDVHRQRSHHIVELRIESNHGNANYTCLYRFRVHGTPAAAAASGSSS